MCPLFKKGDRRVKGNYRGVVLLAMGSRVLARVCARKMREQEGREEIPGRRTIGWLRDYLIWRKRTLGGVSLRYGCCLKGMD